MLGGIVFAWLFAAPAVLAAEPASLTELLQRADTIKSVKPTEFGQLLQTLEQESSRLNRAQHDHLLYLQGWRHAYTGDYAKAIPILESIVERSDNPTLQFRAGSTVTNVLSLSAEYKGAFIHLNKLLNKLSQVENPEARLQGMSVAADLYILVGEYDLALRYADQVIKENANGRGICRGGQIRLDALCKKGRLRSDDPDLQAGINECLQRGESLAANTIRNTRIHLLMKEGRLDSALDALEAHYEEVLQSRYPRGISEWESWMAHAYQQRGETAASERFALRAVEHSVKNHFTRPLVTAYRVLYQQAEKRGDLASALTYLKKSSAADKAYLDDVTARQLAYERVKQDILSSKSQIDALNQENKLLQLQRELDSKAAEASRLYIALLLLVVVFVALWAYRTKRSQLYFMKLSQVDGLTGIANRPRFLDLAENALEAAHKSGQQVSVVLCDLDYFKAINDRYGHAAGDHVLRQAVNACQTHLRVSDIFGRVGGEEFGVVLPGCGLEDAKQRAERLRAAVKALIPEYEGELCPVSASFGVTSTEISGYQLRELLAHADWALYRAKAAGRDRVMPYEAGAIASTAMPSPGDEQLRNASRA